MRINLRQLLFSFQEARRPWGKSFLLAMAIMALACAFIYPLTAPEKYAPIRKHGMDTVERAVGGAFCNNPHASILPDLGRKNEITDWRGKKDSNVSLTYFLQKNPALRDKPLRDAAAAYFDGNLETYCSALKAYTQLHDVGLAAIMYGMLRVLPDLSLNELGYLLYGLRFMLFAAGVLFLMRHGLPLVFGLACAWLCLLADKLHHGLYFYGFYPFISTLLFFSACLFTHMHQSGALSRLPAAFLYALITGVLIAVSAKIRINLMIFTSLLLAITVFSAWPGLPRLRVGKAFLPKTIFVLLFLATVAGAFRATNSMAFDRFIVPQEKLQKGARSLVYHTIAHPILLGLADVENPPDFIKEAGLKKVDIVVHDYVRRSGLDALTPDAETHLWQRYFSLLADNPLAALNLYLDKINEKAVYTANMAFFMLKHPRADLPPDKVYRDPSNPYAPWPLVIALYMLWGGICFCIYKKIHEAYAVFILLTLATAMLFHAEMVVTYSLITVHQYMPVTWLLLLGGVLPFSGKSFRYFTQNLKERHASTKSTATA